jgi:RNA polymerase-binding transcription factor DksA
MLTKSQFTELSEQLEQEQAALQERLLTLDRRLARDDHYNEAEDLGDSATQVFNKEEILFQRNQLVGHLEEIEEALKRIRAGTYGVSEVSGKPIPVDRLRAIPTAKTLVNEQLQ